MQWNESDTAPNDGTVIRALVGDNLQEVLVQRVMRGWMSVGSRNFYPSIEGWLPRCNQGGDVREAGGISVFQSERGWDP